MSKIIRAVFGAGQQSKTYPQWQYDYNTVLQFVGLDLPSTYEVDIANSTTGQSATVLGGADGCVIPAQYFIPGTTIYAWVYIADNNSGYTRAQVSIPISPRAQRTGEAPTPSQQSALDAAIARLNGAADDLKNAVEGIPTAIDNALDEAKQSGEFDGEKGDKGDKGDKGNKGDPGEPGEDGYSPTVTVTEITGGHRVTITDEEHPDGQNFDVLDGQDASSGSSDYDDLSNKPKIGGVTLSGNLSAAELGLSPAGAYVKPSGGIPNSDLAEDAQRGYTSEERVTLVPEGTYTFSADAGDGAGYAYGLDFSSVPDMDFDSPPESVMIVVDGVEYEKQYNVSESEGTDYMAAIYGTMDIPTNDCALGIELHLLRQGITKDAINPVVRLNVMDGEEQHTVSAYFIKQPVTTTPDFDAAVEKASAEALAEKLDTGGDAYRTASIPMGHLDSTSTTKVMTATIQGITELRDGVCMWLRNGVVTSASGVTLNINNLGAKPIYNSIADATATTTTFAKAYTMLFIYNSTRVTGGCWDMVYGYDSNTTYTTPELGFGYGTCTTAAAAQVKTADIYNYALKTGGIVAIKFDNDVPAGASLNISSKGAREIYYKGAPITAGVIKAGDTVTMIYSSYYRVLSIDRDIPAPSDSTPARISAYETPGVSNEYARADHQHFYDLYDGLAGLSASNIPVILYDGQNGVYIPHGPQDLADAFASQVKINFALVVPPNYNSYPVLFTPSKFDTATGELHLTGITGGVLYEATLLPDVDPTGESTGLCMVGTMTTTNLTLPSAQGVSF